MTINIIKIFFITMCLTMVFICLSSFYYVPDSNYSSVNANIIEAVCEQLTNSGYECKLTVNYLIGNSITTNKLIINSNKKYNVGDVICIEYDIYNYLNIRACTKHKEYALISFCSFLILLVISVNIFKSIERSIMDLIDNVLSFVSFM